ncbi:MAG: hypothetical protein EZS28_055021 [Streblomastix strix]|uniref:Uncharacterized protein n=1 Tax=Streblomastix strix TaxID=222440 RepID=A0A5J4Q9T8_9EUKA|nr:MAG: hypothetical protein EZS28_055021 [Streblomastix strix]
MEDTYKSCIALKIDASSLHLFAISRLQLKVLVNNVGSSEMIAIDLRTLDIPIFEMSIPSIRTLPLFSSSVLSTSIGKPVFTSIIDGCKI